MAKNEKPLNHLHVGILSVASIILSILFLTQQLSIGQAKKDNTGFDSFGYNYTARTFNGVLDGADRRWDGKYWGDPTYANDKLKMTWSKGWDNARFNGAPWGPDAWTDNHYNGNVTNGSGEVWHYKIVWVGNDLEESEYWREGGYPIWGQFEVIFSQGTDANGHFWETHASPAGYGLFK